MSIKKPIFNLYKNYFFSFIIIMSESGKLVPNVSVFENDDTTINVETSKIFYSNEDKEELFNYSN